MRPGTRWLLCCALLSVWAAAPGATPEAAGAEPLLTRYLDQLRTLRTHFTQTLSDAHGRELDRASGTLIVVRPGKFSWRIQPAATAPGAAHGSTPGGGQLMVADGRNLWFYDIDLEQVTVKPLDVALSATPAMLLAGTVNLAGHFKTTAAGARDGLEWVLIEPLASDADFRSALFGFAHGDLKRMILEDKLGQTATVRFEQIERNVPVQPGEVAFTPPPGVDVIGTPTK